MDQTFINISIIIFLLAANAFFVAAEFALVKARGFRIEALAAQGSGSARMTVRIQQNMEPYLAACQLGITMASLGLGWVGEPTVAALLHPLFEALAIPERTLHTVAFLVGFVVFSSLHIVVGEQVPKTLAIRKPEPVSLWVAYPLQFFYQLSYPLNWSLNAVTARILKMFNVAEAGHTEVFSGEELRGMIDVSRDHGELEHEKAAMLQNLFSFHHLTVREIMVPRKSADVIDAHAHAHDIAQLIQETRHSRYPVLDKQTEKLVGVVLTKDLHNAILGGTENPLEQLPRFVRKPLVVPETQQIDRLFAAMRKRRAHMALVVDEYGTFAGIVTMEDLLEEIVGEIADELDDTQPQFRIEARGDHWEAHGLVPLVELARQLGYLATDAGDSNTLSGLFMHQLGRMPAVNDEIRDQGYRLRVLEIGDQRVEKVYIEQIPDRSTGIGDELGETS